MRDEFRRKMREDIDLLGSLIDALDGLHERAEAEFDGIEQAEEEGLELFPHDGRRTMHQQCTHEVLGL